MDKPTPGNPYIKKRKTQDSKNIIFARIAQHYFKDGKEMEEQLYPNEMCLGMIPNTSQKGNEFHAALVIKDGDGKVYSFSLVQHHAILKDTPENRKFLQETKEEENAD